MRLWASIVLLVCLCGPAGCVWAAEQPWVSKLRVPLELYPSGQVKTQVTAERAQVTDGGGDINAEGVRIEMFSEEGVVEGVVTTDACTYDKDKEEVTSDAHVVFEGDGIRISGKGFKWRGADESITIHNESRVEFKRAAIADWRKSQS